MDSTAPHAVVTGGAGFVGSHLVDRLLDEGYRVTALDNFGSGRAENLDHIESDRFENQQHDIREPLPSFEAVDVVYHFASRASPTEFRSHAIEIALTNSAGTRNVLDFALAHDSMVVLASTSEVYGDPKEHPQSESYPGNVNIRGPRAPYNESKRFSEALAVAYNQEYNLDIRTVRIFNTFGPRMRPDDGRVIPNFIKQALRGTDLTVYGDGSQTRSFCYISDLIEGIYQIAQANPRVASNEVYNLGSNSEITIRQLAEKVLMLTDSKSGIVYKSRPKDDPQRRRPDLTKVMNEINWEPVVDLTTGLRRTILSFENSDSDWF